jgi:hypothetical protein
MPCSAVCCLQGFLQQMETAMAKHPLFADTTPQEQDAATEVSRRSSSSSSSSSSNSSSSGSDSNAVLTPHPGSRTQQQRLSAAAAAASCCYHPLTQQPPPPPPPSHTPQALDRYFMTRLHERTFGRDSDNIGSDEALAVRCEALRAASAVAHKFISGLH